MRTKALARGLWDAGPAREPNLMRRKFHGPIGVVLAALMLGLLGVGLVLDLPTPALHGEGLIGAIGLVLVVGAIGIELVFDPGTIRWVTLFTFALGAGSLLVAAVQADGTAVIGCYVAVGIAARRLPTASSVLIAVLTGGAVSALILAGGSDRIFTVLWVLVGFGFTYMISRFARVEEQRQARERAFIEEEKRGLVARTEAAALAERGRIARDMHDVLAHSLSALAVELEGARMLAQRDRVAPELEQAIRRAHQHATTGLDEARVAIEALRGDELPGPERLERMAERFAAEQELDCRFEIAGEPRRLDSEASLTIYRTAQEALTNIRKHADADRVEVRLSYAEDGTMLEVADHGSAPSSNGGPVGDALSESGAGYGVSGMRERAELLGGRLDAGTTADGFRVALWLPEAAPA